MQMQPALRLYRGLLTLYPSEFRDRFARELCFLFTDRLRNQPTFGCPLSMYWGVLAEAPEEHLHVIRQDVRYALRTMRRDQAATATAILVLALGIGSTTSIFTLANGLLLRPLPYRNQHTLVIVGELPPGATQHGLLPKLCRPACAQPFARRHRALRPVHVYTPRRYGSRTRAQRTSHCLGAADAGRCDR